jgi:hypothetical protein
MSEYEKNISIWNQIELKSILEDYSNLLDDKLKDRDSLGAMGVIIEYKKKRLERLSVELFGEDLS